MRNLKTICLVLIVSTLTIFALVGCRSVTVTFDTRGGDRLSRQTLSAGDALVLPVPTKEGHTFFGWYSDPSYMYVFENNAIVSQNLTLYALWMKNSYRLTFETQGGFGAFSQTLLYDTPLDIRTTPSKSGHTFMGWYLDPQHQTPLDETMTMPARDLTLYAKWLPDTHRIGFDAQSGSFTQARFIEHGDRLTQPADPTRYEHTFKGWSSSRTFFHLYDFTAPVTRSMTLYAHWQINRYRLTLRIPGVFPHHSVMVDYQADIPWLEHPIEGHTFTGWYEDAAHSQPFLKTQMPNYPVSLYARYDVNDYEVVLYDYLTVPIRQINTQERHTMVLGQNGKIMTFGYNLWGALGDGTTRHRLDPVDITERIPNYDIDPVIQLAGSNRRTFAMTEQGRIFAWGNNSYGALGDGTTTRRTAPIDISAHLNLEPGERVVDMKVQADHNYFLTSTGRVLVFGYNSNFRLGTGNATSERTPVDNTASFPIEEADTLIAIYAGAAHGYALSRQGRLFGWGFNSDGRIGNNTTTHVPLPFELTHLLNLAEADQLEAVYVATNNTFIVTEQGRLFAWGRNHYGQLGVGHKQAVIAPQEITDILNLTGDETIENISLSGDTTFILTSYGRLFASGRNTHGQLGLGTTSNFEAFVEISALFELDEDDAIQRVEADDFHTVVLTSNQRVFTFGSNGRNLQGPEGANPQTTPLDITEALGLWEGETILDFSTKFITTRFLTSANRWVVAGYNQNGVLGTGDAETPSAFTAVTFHAWYALESTMVPYDSMLTLPDWTKENATFAGWHTAADLNSPLATLTMPAHTLKLYASWTREE